MEARSAKQDFGIAGSDHIQTVCDWQILADATGEKALGQSDIDLEDVAETGMVELGAFALVALAGWTIHSSTAE